MRSLDTVIAVALVALMGACAGAMPVRGAQEPSPGGVSVAAADRAVVDFALAHSPTFREQYEAAASLPGVIVLLSSAPGRALGGWPVVAATGWERDSTPGNRAIRCRVRHSGFRELAARMAHELAHAHELASYGRIENAPTFQGEAWDGARETAHAVEVEARVRRELRNVPWQDLSVR